MHSPGPHDEKCKRLPVQLPPPRGPLSWDPAPAVDMRCLRMCERAGRVVEAAGEAFEGDGKIGSKFQPDGPVGELEQ